MLQTVAIGGELHLVTRVVGQRITAHHECHCVPEFGVQLAVALEEFRDGRDVRTAQPEQLGTQFANRPRDAQVRAFRAQLELAATTGLPVFLHQRDAHDEFVAELRPYLPRLSRGVAHCFTGNRDELRELLEIGLWIGITGWICDERRGAHLLEIVGEIPDDRLVLCAISFGFPDPGHPANGFRTERAEVADIVDWRG